jgi:hypothetical protein
MTTQYKVNWDYSVGHATLGRCRRANIDDISRFFCLRYLC